jgi:hypothetical protein
MAILMVHLNDFRIEGQVNGAHIRECTFHYSYNYSSHRHLQACNYTPLQNADVPTVYSNSEHHKKKAHIAEFTSHRTPIRLCHTFSGILR